LHPLHLLCTPPLILSFFKKKKNESKKFSKHIESREGVEWECKKRNVYKEDNHHKCNQKKLKKKKSLEPLAPGDGLFSSFICRTMGLVSIIIFQDY
jgi:hypothetical protein